MIQDIAPQQLKLEYAQKQSKVTDPVFVFRGSNKREDRALVKMDAENQPGLPQQGILSARSFSVTKDKFVLAKTFT